MVTGKPVFLFPPFLILTTLGLLVVPTGTLVPNASDVGLKVMLCVGVAVGVVVRVGVPVGVAVLVAVAVGVGFTNGVGHTLPTGSTTVRKALVLLTPDALLKNWNAFGVTGKSVE